MDIGELALQAQIEWFRLLAACGCPQATVQDGFAVSSGLASNSENGAVVAPEILDRPEDLDRLLAWLRQLELPAILVVTRPIDLEAVGRLTRRGLVPENSGNEMGRTLGPADLIGASDVIGTVAPPGGADVGEVADEGGLRDSYRVYQGDGWWEDPGELEREVEVAVQLGFGPGQPIRHWVARLDGEPVGAATSFRFGDTLYLAHCCVAAPLRRRGLATLLTRARLAAAAAQGATHAVLSPSPDGYLLHRSLGFDLAPTPPNRSFYLF